MCYTIDEIKTKTRPIAENYGVSSVSLFGSYARGEANDESDVDLYIDKGNLKSLTQYFSFVQELEDALKCHVDVVTTDIKDQAFLRNIKREGILLYKAK